jgi:hypothetical protein
VGIVVVLAPQFWQFRYMRILVDIPESSAAAFMARKLEEVTGLPPAEYAKGAIERAAERDVGIRPPEDLPIKHC